jgi:hypothetical protein
VTHVHDHYALQTRLTASEAEDTARDARRTALEPDLIRRRIVRDQLRDNMRQWEQHVDATRSDESRIAEEKAMTHGQALNDDGDNDNNSGDDGHDHSSDHHYQNESSVSTPLQSSVAASASVSVSSLLLPSLGDEDMDDFEEEDSVLLVS